MATAINGRGDLHVRVVSRCLVKASDSSMEPHVLALSNLDLVPQPIQVAMLCVYRKPPATDFGAVVAAFQAGLPSLLNHFFPLAGRIATNPSSGVPEVRCYNQGAELVVGEAGAALASLDYGDVGASLQRIQLPYSADVALSVQVVSFACGGFTVAWRTSHLLVDGSALSSLVTAWSVLARTGTLAAGARPNHDRSVLRLREEASRDGGRRATRVQAVSAYLWKALAGVAPRRHARLLRQRRRLRGAGGERGGGHGARGGRGAGVRRAPPGAGGLGGGAQDRTVRYIEAASIVLGSPAVIVTAFASFPIVTDFGLGHAAMAVPMSVPTARLCSGYVEIIARPGGDGSWIVKALLWPQLAAALEADEPRVFKLVTAVYLGLFDHTL
ncbi:hypothetical protein ACP70R_030192 [Stipagrostis hirtigluma subsp. patula]